MNKNTKLRDLKQLLYTAAYHPHEIENFLNIDKKSFLTFDPELGYIQTDYIFRDGMEETLSEYVYEHKLGMARKIVNYPERPCRINTYGDSFTQSAQVSDGETWQEFLAMHFREPIRNYGVGGYGVYHAYLRAMRTEKVKKLAAKYIVLNIWDDDHMRSLDAARWIRVAWMCRDLPRGKKGGYPVHGFPWCHLRYDTAKRKWLELPGICKKASDLRKLVGKENYYNTFKDDSVAHLCALREGGVAPVEECERLAKAFGIKVNLRNPKTRQKDAEKLHIAYGIRSTMYVLNKLRAWCKKTDRKLMILLTHDFAMTRDHLKGKPRFDQEFVDFLKKEKYEYVDILTKKKEDFKSFKGSAQDFLRQFWVSRAGAQVFGHYNPYGNFWYAHAIRKELVNWLDPKPPAYR